MKNFLQSSKILMILTLLLVSPIAISQVSYTFTTCGATGNQGPSQAQVNTEYATTNLNGLVTSSSGIQTWQVPSSGTYIIEAVGAKGGGANGGKGARMIGEFNLTGGSTLKILVGQQGEEYTTGRIDYSGGGGSYVTDATNTPFIVAGGGGGAHIVNVGADGSTATSGNNGGGGHSNGNGGSGGAGGTYQNQTSDGGAGITGNGGSGNPNPAPQAFVNGGQGGCNSWGSATCANGGFGGGGGTNRNSTSWWACGGGGGYSGGGAGYGSPTNHPYAGGGGSYNNGVNQMNTSGFGTGDGVVIITRAHIPKDDAGISKIKGFDVQPCKGTQPVEVVVNNFGANQINPVTVDWEIDGVPQPNTVINTTLDTVNGLGVDTHAVIIGNVTVNGPMTIKVWTEMPNNRVDSLHDNDTMTVTIGEPFSVDTIIITDSIACNGGEDVIANITGKGGTPPYSYLWSNNGTSALLAFVSAGQYKCVMTDNAGCKDSATVNITEPDPIAIAPAVTPIVNNSVNNGSIILNASGGTPPLSYSWTHGPTNANLTGLAVGTYDVVITDNNSCADTFSIEVASVVGISEQNNNSGLEIYPNPSTTGLFNIKLEGFTGEKTIQVRNTMGKLINEYKVSENQTKVDLSGHANGIYLVMVSDGKTESIQRILFE